VLWLLHLQCLVPRLLHQRCLRCQVCHRSLVVSK